MMLLALANDPASTSIWLENLFYILGGILTAVLLYKQLSPQEWKSHVENIRQDQRQDKTELRDELESKTDKIHDRISGLRNALQADYAKLGDKVINAANEMKTMHTDAVKSIGEINGCLEQQTRQLAQTDMQLRRHIEKHGER